MTPGRDAGGASRSIALLRRARRGSIGLAPEDERAARVEAGGGQQVAHEGLQLRHVPLDRGEVARRVRPAAPRRRAPGRRGCARAACAARARRWPAARAVPRAAGPGARPSRRTSGASAPISSRRVEPGARREVALAEPPRHAGRAARCGRAIARASGADTSASTSHDDESDRRGARRASRLRDARATAGGSGRARPRCADEVPWPSRAVPVVSSARRLGGGERGRRDAAGRGQPRPSSRVHGEVHVQLVGQARDDRAASASVRNGLQEAARRGGPAAAGFARKRSSRPRRNTGERRRQHHEHEQQHAVQVDPPEERAGPAAHRTRPGGRRAGSPRRGRS